MRTKTKALTLALCAVLLVVTTVFVTMAYLTSQDSVTNTFTVGKVAITLDEQDTDNSTEGENDRDKENNYHLIPGKSYTKDPIIHVSADSEQSYLFVEIKNDIEKIEASGNTTIAAQMNAKGWKKLDQNNNIYYYALNAEEGKLTAVSKNTDVSVFDSFEIADSVTNDTLKAYVTNNDKTSNIIAVTAYAVQADGFDGKTPVEIWNAAFGKTE